MKPKFDFQAFWTAYPMRVRGGKLGIFSEGKVWLRLGHFRQIWACEIPKEHYPQECSRPHHSYPIHFNPELTLGLCSHMDLGISNVGYSLLLHIPWKKFKFVVWVLQNSQATKIHFHLWVDNVQWVTAVEIRE